MKKRLSLLALVLCLIFACTACKDDDKEGGKIDDPKATVESDKKDEGTKAPAATKAPLSTDPTTVKDVTTLDTNVEGINLKDYIVALGKYKGVEIKALSTEVTDKDIQEEVKVMLENYPTYEELDNEIAEDANYVNIDFVGKIDGKEFEGGSAKDTMLLLGSKTYIDGFEAGIVGMKKGETKDLNLVFPTDYHNATYAGKKVVFTVTLNKIMKKVETKYTDEFVKENFYDDYKLSTVKEMNEYIKTALVTEKKEAAKTYKTTTVLETIVKESEFKELPQQWINLYYAEEFSYYETVAKSYGIELEDYLGYYYLTLDQFKKDCIEYAVQAVKEDIVLYAIIESEKMEITDEYYAEQVNKIFEGYKAYYKDLNEFVEDNGGKEEVARKLLLIKARDFAVDNATVVGTIDEIPTKDDNKSEDKAENSTEDAKDQDASEEADKKSEK